MPANKTKGKNLQDPITVEEREKRRNIRSDAFLAVLIDSVTSMFNNRPAQAAASIAYYSLFSIFPLFLFMVIILSYYMEFSIIQQKLTIFLQDVLPGSEKLIVENLQNIIVNRGSTSLWASITLLWSGSGMFSGIINNIQKAWPEARERGYFINRALAILGILVLILIVAVLMTFSLVFNFSEALALFNIQINRPIQVIINLFTSYIFPCIFLYVASFMMYYHIPPAEVDRDAAKISAVVFALVWRLFTAFFGAYMLSPMNRYDLVYGSVTVIVLMLLYIYFSAFIMLYPAYLAAAITHFKQRRVHRVTEAEIKRQREEKRAQRKAAALRAGLPDPVSEPFSEYRTTTASRPAQRNIWQVCLGLIKDMFRWK